MEQLDSLSPGNLRILLIEPREDVRSGLARRLRADDRVAELAGVPGVRDAVELLDSASPNVVLVDPGAWDAGGRDAVFTLVDVRRRSTWFLIALHVAHPDRPDAFEANTMGADVCLLKGLRTSDLVATLTRHVATRRMD